jgi:hypothetical protein
MPLKANLLRLPVKLVDGTWEALYGGAIKVRDGTLGDLLIDRSSIEDPGALRALTRPHGVKVLPAGTELRVALTLRGALDAELREVLLPSQATVHGYTAQVGGSTWFVSVWLAGPTPVQHRTEMQDGGLWLRFDGMEPRSVESGRVKLPAVLGLAHVDSLNEAFTRLSEVFEPWRKAHTGSIYERVFYREAKDFWYPLKDLRERALANAERLLITDLWNNATAQFGTLFPGAAGAKQNPKNAT